MAENLKIKALGGAREVGRSGFLVSYSGEKYLFDYGLKINIDVIESLEYPERQFYPLPIRENVNGVILSHAHLDHSGLIPKLFDKDLFSYMHPATLDISKILWKDTIKIADLNKEKFPFPKENIRKADKYTFALGYDKEVQISDKTFIEFKDAGHILGSCLCYLSIDNKKILYTGDFKIEETNLHKGVDLRKLERNLNVLMIESTYGDREHPDRNKEEKRFVESCLDVVENGGNVVAPSFAVGRSQELAEILYRHKFPYPVYMDGMGKTVSNIFLNYPKSVKDFSMLKKSLKHTIMVESPRERNKVLKSPSVVITTAGMMQGGPVYYYLPEIYDNERNAVFLTGFQVEKTPGRQVLEKKEIFVDDQRLKLKADVKKFDFSAHAGKKDLFSMVKKSNPEHVVLVHGDSKVIDILKKDLEKEGFKVHAPYQGDVLTLK